MADPQPEASPGLGLAKGELERFRAAIESVRARADLTAKGISGLAVTGLTAIGIAKIADVFPYEGPGVALVGLFTGFIAMAIAAFLFARRLWRSQEPIVMGTDPDKIEGLSDDERDQVKAIFKRIAELNSEKSLADYEEKARKLEAEAEKSSTTKAKAKELREKVELITTEILATFARAAVTIVQGRTTNALRDTAAVALFILFFVGLLGFAISSDALDSRRSGEIALAKSCAEARTAGATDLPEEACGEAPPKDPEKSASQVSAQGVADLAAARRDCLAAAERDAVDPSKCAAISQALSVALTAQQ